VPPNVTFDQSLTLHLESRPLELRFYGRAHTRGDVVAHLPTEGVTFAGDLAFHKYIPNARDGFPSDWVAAASRFEKLAADVIVPGHGPLGGMANVTEMRECLALIVEQATRSFEAGLDATQAREALKLGAFASWGRQEDRLPTLVERLYMELRGEL